MVRAGAKRLHGLPFSALLGLVLTARGPQAPIRKKECQPKAVIVICARDRYRMAETHSGSVNLRRLSAAGE